MSIAVYYSFYLKEIFKRFASSAWPLFTCLLMAAVFGGSPLPAQDSAASSVQADELEAQEANLFRQSIVRLEPMDYTGLDYGLGSVLRNYYKQNFTSAENWEQFQSIRFEGTLELAHGTVRFTAFKKKPDYCKVVIFASNGGRIVMAYDGTEAWQLNTMQGSGDHPDRHQPGSDWNASQPVATMPGDEALNFIRDASTGGHLLYPLLEGKQLQILGTTTVEGERCYELKITLPDGQIVRSMLDMKDYSERRQVVINNVNGDEEVTTHSDFRQIDGIRVPFSSTLTIDGEQVHQVRLQTVQTDLGVMPWMFSRSSGTYVPSAHLEQNISPSVSKLVGGGTVPPVVESPLYFPSSTGFASPSFSAESGPLAPQSRFHIDPDLLTPIEVDALLRETAPSEDN